MKKSFLLIGLALLAALAGCQPPTIGEDLFVDTTGLETLAEWYLEQYDNASGHSLTGWYYNADGTLKEYVVFHYDGNGDNDILYIYANDMTTLIGRFEYTYDGDGQALTGNFYRDLGSGLALQGHFLAAYEAPGRYASFKEWDAADAIMEHRTCAWDAGTGKYTLETYYSGEDAVPLDVIEQYTPTYDAGTGNYVKENHYLKLVGNPADGFPDYTKYTVHTFTWGSQTRPYLQTDFQSDNSFVSGDMTAAIMYTFISGTSRPATRSFFNQEGRLMLYRTYQYDVTGEVSETRYYNYAANPGNELDTKKVYRYFTRNAGAEYMYEEKTYTYGYPARGPRSIQADAPERGSRVPECAHYRAD